MDGADPRDLAEVRFVGLVFLRDNLGCPSGGFWRRAQQTLTGDLWAQSRADLFGTDVNRRARCGCLPDDPANRRAAVRLVDGQLSGNHNAN